MIPRFELFLDKKLLSNRTCKDTTGKVRRDRNSLEETKGNLGRRYKWKSLSISFSFGVIIFHVYLYTHIIHTAAITTTMYNIYIYIYTNDIYELYEWGKWKQEKSHKFRMYYYYDDLSKWWGSKWHILHFLRDSSLTYFSILSSNNVRGTPDPSFIFLPTRTTTKSLLLFLLTTLFTRTRIRLTFLFTSLPSLSLTILTANIISSLCHLSRSLSRPLSDFTSPQIKHTHTYVCFISTISKERERDYISHKRKWNQFDVYI